MTKAPSRDVQRALFQALRDRPLDLMNEADRKLYQPLHEPDHDPVKQLFDTIDFSGAQSVQLVAGFRGTGKSTELSRLEKQLWESDFHVIRVDLDRHVDMTSPVDIREFLLILAGAITEQLTQESLLGTDKQIEKSLFERARALLPTTKELTAKGGIVDIKLALRGDVGFRGQVRDALKGRVGELEREIRAHQDDIRAALSKRAGRPVRLVVIIDSLEHLRGTGESSDEVRRSVEELFFTHASRISLPETHMVLSVPAFLALHGDNLAAQFVNGQLQAWPAFRVRDRAGESTSGVDSMVDLVERRGDWREILPNREALVKLILASGGHLRDLLNMLIESIHVAGSGVADGAALRIVKIAQRAYLPLYKDEIEILRKIADDKGLAGIDLDGGVVLEGRESLKRLLRDTAPDMFSIRAFIAEPGMGPANPSARLESPSAFSLRLPESVRGGSRPRNRKGRQAERRVAPTARRAISRCHGSCRHGCPSGRAGCGTLESRAAGCP